MPYVRHPGGDDEPFATRTKTKKQLNEMIRGLGGDSRPGWTRQRLVARYREIAQALRDHDADKRFEAICRESHTPEPAHKGEMPWLVLAQVVPLLGSLEYRIVPLLEAAHALADACVTLDGMMQGLEDPVSRATPEDALRQAGVVGRLGRALRDRISASAVRGPHFEGD